MTGFSRYFRGVRTDRLVALLLMLQRREQVTVPQVARELEVSERTARRDLDALAASGVPVYSIRGRHGGWRLVGGARTDLSGLSAGEARALFLVAGPVAADIPAVRTALRKLVRALPEPFRDPAEAAASSLVLDPHPWGASRAAPPPPPFLDALQDAVIRGEQVRLGYVDGAGAASERTIHPLGIVAKGRSWYVVATTDSGRRTFRIDRVSSVVPTGDQVQRPADFDLGETWREISDEVDRRRAPVEVRGTCAPDGVPYLRVAMGDDLDTGGTDDDGRVAVVLRGPSEDGLAGHLAGLVPWLEVTSPPAVREHLADIGEALVSRYR